MTRVQQGFSLVELMVGIAIGLMVVATVSLLMGHQLQDTRRLRIETQMEQDLRAAADLVVRDLRRTGYSPEAADGAVVADLSAGSPGQPSGSMVYTRYQDDATTVQPAGLKLEDGVLKLLSGGSGWQPITDPALMKVVALRIELRRLAVPLAVHCADPCPADAACPPTQEVRAVDIAIDGLATEAPEVVRTLRLSARLRNDRVVGRCGA